MTYEEWKEGYGLVYEPNYSLGTEADCRAAFIAGAASRDAEIASLTGQRNRQIDTCATRENEIIALEKECDQLREQIASLKDELRQISTAIDDVRLDLTNTAAELIMEMKEQLASRDAEVERYAYVVQQVRKALCGDIHNTEDLLVLITSLQAERNQLREQVKLLRDALNRIRTDDQQHMLIKHKALAATEPKP